MGKARPNIAWLRGGVVALVGGARKTAALAVMENRDIAKAAFGLVRDGSLIIVHGGSICHQFGCDVAHRNMPVAGRVADRRNHPCAVDRCAADRYGQACDRAVDPRIRRVVQGDPHCEG